MRDIAEELNLAYQEVLLRGPRTDLVDLITLRGKHSKEEGPKHRLVSSAAFCRGFGVVGDRAFDSERTDDVAIMDSRVLQAIRLVFPETRGVYPGDTLLIDTEVHRFKPGDILSFERGTELVVSPNLHTACDRFVARFGKEAAKWVNQKKGMYRGVKADITKSGLISVGDWCWATEKDWTPK